MSRMLFRKEITIDDLVVWHGVVEYVYHHVFSRLQEDRCGTFRGQAQIPPDRVSLQSQQRLFDSAGRCVSPTDASEVLQHSGAPDQ